jgi:peptidoglycan/LPS O-acetylase OafA/YrhL
MSLETPSSSHRLIFLDSLRALAAIFVVLHHAAINYYDHVGKNFKELSDFDLHGLKLIIIKVFYHGHFAVDLFIVLSGFSLMLSVLKSDYNLKGGSLLFFKRRIIRIVPTYYAAIALSLILISTVIGDQTQTHWDVSIPVGSADLITHLLLISDFFNSTTNTISHVFWSICVESRIYLFFPILLWIWRKKGALSALSFSIFTSVAGLLLLGVFKEFGTSDINTQLSGVSPYIILFVLGMLAADLSLKDGKTQATARSFYKKMPVLILIAGVLLVGVTIVFGRFLLIFNDSRFIEYSVLYDQLRDIAFGILCSIFIFALTLAATNQKKTSIVHTVLNWKPLALVGTFSYSLYLVHPVVLQVVSKFIIIPLHTDRFTAAVLLAAIGTIASLIASCVFFLGCERPFMTLGKKPTAKAVMQRAIVDPAI